MRVPGDTPWVEYGIGLSLCVALFAVVAGPTLALWTGDMRWLWGMAFIVLFLA